MREMSLSLIFSNLHSDRNHNTWKKTQTGKKLTKQIIKRQQQWS